MSGRATLLVMASIVLFAIAAAVGIFTENYWITLAYLVYVSAAPFVSAAMVRT